VVGVVPKTLLRLGDRFMALLTFRDVVDVFAVAVVRHFVGCGPNITSLVLVHLLNSAIGVMNEAPRFFFLVFVAPVLVGRLISNPWAEQYHLSVLFRRKMYISSFIFSTS